jgi:hypothetical protein
MLGLALFDNHRHQVMKQPRLYQRAASATMDMWSLLDIKSEQSNLQQR